MTLKHKVSKPRLRSKPPPPALVLDLTTHQVIETPPDSAFKMFWKKKEKQPISLDPPRPILKTRSENVPEMFAPMPARMSSRKSSRPGSPASTSFGSRALHTPPMSAHITTPPTAHIATMSRAPPSPYRPTHERQRSRTFPEVHHELYGPPRHSSLFSRPESLFQHDVPMLNIIPATPQDNADGFRDYTLDEPIMMEEIPLDLPSIDVEFDFSPFVPSIELPAESTEPITQDSSDLSLPLTSDLQSAWPEAPTAPLPPSPPFSFFPEPSMPSFPSIPSSISTASTSSLQSFPDVEEALGSMLASLETTKHNPGLGLGLDLDDTITAPLSPRRRPPPLKLVHTKVPDAPRSAPARINSHRIPFYSTTRPYPSSAQSDSSLHSSNSSLRHYAQAVIYDNPRDSISTVSSDDDLHTASIINISTPLARAGSIVRAPDVVGLAL